MNKWNVMYCFHLWGLLTSHCLEKRLLKKNGFWMLLTIVRILKCCTVHPQPYETKSEIRYFNVIMERPQSRNALFTQHFSNNSAYSQTSFQAFFRPTYMGCCLLAQVRLHKITHLNLGSKTRLTVTSFYHLVIRFLMQQPHCTTLQSIIKQ